MQNLQEQSHTDVDVNGSRPINAADELVGAYNAAIQQLRNLISSETEPSSEQISYAEAEAEAAFDALLVADLSSRHEILIRAQFLLTEIRNSVDAGSLADRMAKSVEDDVLKVSKIS